ncbi:hypothetical protein TWF694_002954 [Orbilia ellipsospora]|uniref:Uncharacterized protein n=1 Tax=Orbilia ellipsospora TaxID=2528407 RepID=A0AAV9X070_9PEZI
MSDPKRRRMLSPGPSDAEIEYNYDRRLESILPIKTGAGDTLQQQEGKDLGQVEVIKRIFELLRDPVTHFGSPAISAVFSSVPNPGIHIRDFGTLRLPISLEDAGVLASVATTDDDAKPKVIGLESIEICNFQWNKWLKGYIEDLAKEMGIKEDFLLDAKLEGLRVYTVGQQFNMNGGGTGGRLEITLPGEFEGGDLSLSYKNEVKTVNFGKGIMWDTVVAAWYPEVILRAAPLSRGYRITMIYDLASGRNSGSRTYHLSADKLNDTASKLAKALEDVRAMKLPIVYVLKHQTQYSLVNTRDNFSGSDQVVVQNLIQAVNKVGNLALYCGDLVGRDYTDSQGDGWSDDYPNEYDEFDYFDTHVNQTSFPLERTIHLGGTER